MAYVKVHSSFQPVSSTATAITRTHYHVTFPFAADIQEQLINLRMSLKNKGNKF